VFGKRRGGKVVGGPNMTTLRCYGGEQGKRKKRPGSGETGQLRTKEGNLGDDICIAGGRTLPFTMGNSLFGSCKNRDVQGALFTKEKAMMGGGGGTRVTQG